MGRDSNIGWTNFTASPWFGCTEVDACCTFCYSRELTKGKFAFAADDPNKAGVMRRAYHRAGFADWATRPVWGDKATRVLSKAFWKDVYRWNREAGEAEQQRCREFSDTAVDEPYERPRIFTSLIDWLDRMPAGIIDQDGKQLNRIEVLANFLRVIRDTPNLDWLLLTKRIENFSDDLHEVVRTNHDGVDEFVSTWLDGIYPQNVWFGWTAGTKAKWIERHEVSWSIPAKIHWVSAEPLLDYLCFPDLLRDPECISSHNIDWIVIGGESGRNRRDLGAAPIISLAESAKAHNCRVYVKQDFGMLPGTQGRIPENIWALKEFPG